VQAAFFGHTRAQQWWVPVIVADVLPLRGARQAKRYAGIEAVVLRAPPGSGSGPHRVDTETTDELAVLRRIVEQERTGGQELRVVVFFRSTPMYLDLRPDRNGRLEVTIHDAPIEHYAAAMARAKRGLDWLRLTKGPGRSTAGATAQLRAQDAAVEDALATMQAHGLSLKDYAASRPKLPERTFRRYVRASRHRRLLGWLRGYLL